MARMNAPRPPSPGLTACLLCLPLRPAPLANETIMDLSLSFTIRIRRLWRTIANTNGCSCSRSFVRLSVVMWVAQDCSGKLDGFLFVVVIIARLTCHARCLAIPWGDRLQNGEEKLQGHKIPIRSIVLLVLFCLSACLLACLCGLSLPVSFPYVPGRPSASVPCTTALTAIPIKYGRSKFRGTYQELWLNAFGSLAASFLLFPTPQSSWNLAFLSTRKIQNKQAGHRGTARREPSRV